MTIERCESRFPNDPHNPAPLDVQCSYELGHIGEHQFRASGQNGNGRVDVWWEDPPLCRRTGREIGTVGGIQLICVLPEGHDGAHELQPLRFSTNDGTPRTVHVTWTVT